MSEYTCPSTQKLIDVMKAFSAAYDFAEKTGLKRNKLFIWLSNLHRVEKGVRLNHAHECETCRDIIESGAMQKLYDMTMELRHRTAAVAQARHRARYAPKPKRRFGR